MIRKFAIGGMATLLWLLSAAPSADAGFTPQGKAALLLDGASGQILYQYNASDKNYPASTTKLLTALVAVEHGKLEQVITVSETAVDMPPDSSACYLEKGEQQTLQNLLYGLLLASGNDCANAIAEGLTNGKPEQFIQWMNETAARVGATSSSFANPHGYHQEGHITTAKDLALIARAALNNPEVRKIAGTTDYFWPGKSEKNGVYYNHNQMLFTYEGSVGGKTGYTEQAGLTLVSSAVRDNHFLVGVVMGEKFKLHQYEDMKALLDMGFTEWTRKPAVTAGTAFGEVAVTGAKETTVPVEAKHEFMVSVPRDGKSQVTTRARLNENVAAPVKAGQTVGALEVLDGERLLGTVPLVARVDVAARPSPFKGVLSGTLTVLKWLAYTAVGLLLFRISVKSIRRLLRRSRKKNAPYRPAAGSARGSIDIYRTRSR